MEPSTLKVFTLSNIVQLHDYMAKQEQYKINHPTHIIKVQVSGDNGSNDAALLLDELAKEQNQEILAKIVSLNFGKINHDYFLLTEHAKVLAAILDKMSELKWLILTAKDISSEGMVLIAKALPKSIRYLDLSGNGIDSDVAIDIANSLAGTDIAYLILRNNNIGGVGIRALTDKLPKSLFLLDLSGNLIEEETIENLGSFLLSCFQLNQLILENTQLNAETAQRIIKCLSASLEELDLSANPIGDSGVISIMAELPEKCPHLQTLFFKNINLGKQGVEAIVYSLPKLPKLVSLILYGNKLGVTEAAILGAACGKVEATDVNVYFGVSEEVNPELLTAFEKAKQHARQDIDEVIKLKKQLYLPPEGPHASSVSNKYKEQSVSPLSK
ncbi:leucine-rich repeat domain-containing protein [Rickettsiales endosymbiont of Stachyamoeba lipophora]|uniref:hypothetical protein n=1 Tax=Rickettsiales endosymbiont of Stachyamoeba lipophora TaxID=2486578 RepID=UPI000F646F20|nr:hypothetical protein [Rickettsiales endosymbiont of Stachyamoeba lipophora]AZL16138.1 hypothetical protein EF513_06290 [Rickettsiales endosymbiont of Stachyamoeba lipophora]